MPKLGSSGSVRGAFSNGCPYREQVSCQRDSARFPRGRRHLLMPTANLSVNNYCTLHDYKIEAKSAHLPIKLEQVL